MNLKVFKCFHQFKYQIYCIFLYIHIIFCHFAEGKWRWEDGTDMPILSSPWHEWYEGEPDNKGGNENCLLLTNYLWWVPGVKPTIPRYAWVDYYCDILMGKEIQGYICERNRDN